MNQIWVPEATPPQVSPDAHKKVVELVYGNVLNQNWDTYAFLFGNRHEPLMAYMAEFGLDKPSEDARRDKVFRIGGVLAGLAYLESGYDLFVDEETFSAGLSEAESEGIPEAYITKLSVDPNLGRIIEDVTPVADASFAANDESFKDVLGLGAGCVRHYFTSAIEAA